MDQETNRLAQDFDIWTLLKFTAPTAIMMVFMSLYQMVDGAFIARFVGENALSALNIVYPVISVLIAFSVMLAAGGSAIIAKNIGEGKEKEARENFSLIVFVGLLSGLSFTIIGTIFIRPLLDLLGVTPILYSYANDYLRIIILTAPLSVFQMLFQFFFVTAGKPQIGLFLTILGGISNIVLDYIFIVLCNMGVSGAAIATSIGYAIPALFGIGYFFLYRKGVLYFVKPVFRAEVLIHSITNGSSEMVNNLAIAITTFLFNSLMMKYVGESGVAAITIVLYAQFLMTSVFMGFSNGIAPAISYNYGSQNTEQLKKIFKNCLYVIAAISIAVFLIAEVCAIPIINIFVTSESEAFQLTKHGFTIFSFSLLFSGINIFSSALFTAFSNGKVSAILSFLRTFVFLSICLLLLPILWDVDGIWISVPVAELLAFIVSVYCLVNLRKDYNY